MPRNPAYLTVSRKALKKIWQLEDILLLLVLNRKTSNVNMESYVAYYKVEKVSILKTLHDAW